MHYLPLIKEIQIEQMKNPLNRYKGVREFYSEAINENCIFHNLGEFANRESKPRPEPFPKSLFPKFTPSRLYPFCGNTYHAKVLPVSLDLAMEICEKFGVDEKTIKIRFQWDHQYAVCPEIKTPFTSFDQLNAARYQTWIKVTPEWLLRELEEMKNAEI